MLARILLLLALSACTGQVATAGHATPAPGSSGAPGASSKARDCEHCTADAASEPEAAVAALTLSGRVTGAGGAVSGAVVAVSAPGKGFVESALSGPNGEFSLAVAPGADYLLSAHHGRWGSSTRAAGDGSQGQPLELQLERHADSTNGVLQDELGQPFAGARIELYRRTGPGQGSAYAVALTDDEGRFELRVPAGAYAIMARFQKQEAGAVPFALPLAAGLSLQLFRQPPSDAPASAEELAFVRKYRRALADGSAAVWTQDWLKGVEVVGIGEQTHGAREAITARFALAKSLITDHGFNVVALEAGHEAAWMLSEWTRGKPGDVRVAVDRLGMWLWQTGEMVEFVSWLRAENARRGAANAVELVGVYGYSHFPLKLEALRDRLKTSGGQGHARLLREVPDVAACEQLDAAFASGEHWARARQRDPVLALMLDSVRRCDLGASTAYAGEAFAAEVCQRILSSSPRAGKGPRKLVLLAHNGHIARARVGRAQQDILGQYLARALGARYRAVGVTIGTGRFSGSLFDPKSPSAPGRRTLELDELRAGSLESVLSSGGELFFLPSRSDEGELWSGPVRLMRNIGASYAPAHPANYWSPALLPSAYDAIVYVAHVEPVVERPWAK